MNFIRLSSQPVLLRTVLLLVAILSLAAPLAQSAHAASLIVTTIADTTITDGLCSLREAITNANNDAATFSDCAAGTGNDTITFSGTGLGTIILVSALPNITDVDGLTINGAGGVILDGANAFRVFDVFSATANLTLRNLTIQNARPAAGAGGAIAHNGNALVVDNVTFLSNSSNGNGGAISNGGTSVQITNSTFTSNASITANGGAISNSGTLSVDNTAFTTNSVASGNGVRSSTRAALSRLQTTARLREILRARTAGQFLATILPAPRSASATAPSPPISRITAERSITTRRAC
jgi:CSLREA domain-containing protein